uniref:Thaumatin-like protein n=1 Tax=Panagrolaimus davidi TaxID=227884 RepID=A0A914Q3S1_9BILA
MLKLFVAFALFFECVSAVKFTLVNNCGGPIWPGIQGSTLPEGGGFQIAQGGSHDVYVPDRWQAGRFWTRTWCDNSYNCGTGFCGNKLQCGGAGGRPPASLAEFTLGGAGNQDYYDISLVDGWNVQVRVEPIGGTFQSNGGPMDCKAIGQCNADVNSKCPPELQLIDPLFGSGQVIGCYSACTKFNTDYYCCRGAYGTPQSCKSSTWPINYPKIFKDICPQDYSYAYDDTSSTFTCRGNNGRVSPDYKITFC